MKPYSIADRQDQIVDDESTTRMSINADVMNVIMSALTNMYSNPETAVVREYLANAIDAHRASQVDQPVILTLPSYDKPLIVQDFGAGLSSQQILSLFSGYGESLKRENNNLIGGFGLGSKSALAITDMFSITSIHQGVKTDAIVGRGASGGGYVRVESTHQTSEPSGTTVTINFASGRGRSSSGAFSYLGRHDELSGNLLFRGYGPEELVVKQHEGDAVVHYRSIHEDGMVEVKDGMGSVLGWFRDPAHSSYDQMAARQMFFVIGGVVYEHGYDHYRKTSPLGLNVFPALEIYLNIPIGGMDLVPSRESIISSDRSKQAAESIYKQFMSVLGGKMRENVNSASGHADALKVRNSWAKTGMDVSDLTWQGEIIPTHFNYSELLGGTIRRRKKNRNSTAAVTVTEYSKGSYAPETSHWMEGTSQRVVLLDKKLTLNALKRSTAALLKASSSPVQISYAQKKSDNVWFNSVTEYVTADWYRDMIRSLRADAPQGRKVSGDYYFVLNVGEAENGTMTVVSESVENINAASKVYYVGGDQERVLPAALYSLRPKGSPKTCPSYRLALQTATGDFLKSRLSGEKIVLLSSQSKVDKFLNLTPDAEHLPLTSTLKKAVLEDIERTATSAVNYSAAVAEFHYRGAFYSAGNWLGRMPASFLPDLPDALRGILDLKVFLDEKVNKVDMPECEKEHNRFVKEYSLLGGWWSNPQVVPYDTSAVRDSFEEFCKEKPLFTLTSPTSYGEEYYRAMFDYFKG